MHPGASPSHHLPLCKAGVAVSWGAVQWDGFGVPTPNSVSEDQCDAAPSRAASRSRPGWGGAGRGPQTPSHLTTASPQLDVGVHPLPGKPQPQPPTRRVNPRAGQP